MRPCHKQHQFYLSLATLPTNIEESKRNPPDLKLVLLYAFRSLPRQQNILHRRDKILFVEMKVKSTAICQQVSTVESDFAFQLISTG